MNRTDLSSINFLFSAGLHKFAHILIDLQLYMNGTVHLIRYENIAKIGTPSTILAVLQRHRCNLMQGISLHDH